MGVYNRLATCSSKEQLLIIVKYEYASWLGAGREKKLNPCRW
jgi:hypothetical protein